MGARTYAIACLTDEDFDLILAQRAVHDGDIKSFIDYDEQLIVVRSRLQPDHRRELIVHELIHAAAADAGLQQNDITEGLIAALAPRLSVMLVDGLNDVLDELR